MANYSYFSGGGSGISPLPPNFAQLATAGPAAIAQGMKEASQAIGDALKEKQKAAKLKKKEATSSVQLIKAHLANESKLNSLRGIDIDDLDNMSSDDQIALGGQIAAERQAQITQSSLDTAEQQRQSVQSAANEKSDTNRIISELMQNPNALQTILPMAGNANMAQVLQARLNQAASGRDDDKLGIAREQNARNIEKHAYEIEAAKSKAEAPRGGTITTLEDGSRILHTGGGGAATFSTVKPQTPLEAAKAREAQAKAAIFESIANKTKGGVNVDNLSGLNNMQKQKVKRLQDELQVARDNMKMIEKLGNDAPFVNYDGDVINEDKSKRQQSDAETWTWGEMSRSAAKTLEERKIRDLEKQIEEITGQQRANEVVDRIINQELDPNDRAGIYN